MPSHQVRPLLIEGQRKRFRRSLKIRNRMLRAELKINPQAPRGLRLIRIRPQRYRKIGFQVLHGNGFVIFKFQPLCSIRRNRHNLCAEDRASLCFFRAALAHLKQSWIDRLSLQLVVNLLGSLAFQNGRGNSCRSVPYGKI